MPRRDPSNPLPRLPEGEARTPGVVRTTVCVLSGLIGILGGGRLIAPAVDARPEARLERGESSFKKTRSFRQVKDEVEVVFVGSSRVQRGIHPASFDAALAERGYDIRSFNFGIGGIRFPETLYWIEWILSQEPERLRCLVIELQPLEQWIQPAHGWTSKRFTNWHTLASTRVAVEAVGSVDLSVLSTPQGLEPMGPDERVRGHLERLLHRFFFVGVGVGTVREWTAPPRAPILSDGYDWKDGAELNLGPAWKRFQAQPSTLGFGPLTREAGRVLDEPEALDLRVFAELVVRVQDAGVIPVFITGPGGRPRHETRDAFHAGGLPNLYAYELGMGWRLAQEAEAANPGGAPRPEDFFSDSLHLNVAGAKLFGRLLAQDLEPLLRSRNTIEER